MPKRSSKTKAMDVNEMAKKIVSNTTEDIDSAKTLTLSNAAAELGRRGGKKGGKARAAALSKKDRSDQARRAAQGRWGNKGAIRASHVGELRIAEKIIPCAVLEDGTRVLTQKGFYQAIGRSGTPAAGRGSERGKLAPFLAIKQLEGLISENLKKATTPIEFQLPGGGWAWGYKAEILPGVCDVYILAQKEGRLNKAQEKFAVACSILKRGFERIGIAALIDEATGYQYHRPRNALEEILQAFIAKELQPWMKTFPDAFYKEIYRLKGWPTFDMGHKRPQIIGKITNDIVYSRIAPGVLSELRKANPKTNKGTRKSKHFQWLTHGEGHPRLRTHLEVLIALMQAFDDWDTFYKKLNQIKPDLNAPMMKHMYPPANR